MHEKGKKCIVYSDSDHLEHYPKNGKKNSEYFA